MAKRQQKTKTAAQHAAETIEKASAGTENAGGGKRGEAGSVCSAGSIARTRVSPRRKLGRGEAMALICEEMTSGKSARTIFVEHSAVLPSRWKFEEWLSKFPSLRQAFRTAQEHRAAVMADGVAEMIEEAPERYSTEFGDRIDPASVALMKARADVHLRIAERLLPERWGEKTTTHHDGAVQVQHSGTVALMPLDTFAGRLTKLAAPAVIDAEPEKDGR